MRLFRRRRDPVADLLRALSARDFVADTQGRLIDVAARRRLAAVHGLAAHDGPEVRRGLAGALTDPDASVRAAALELLSARPGAIPARDLAASVLSVERAAAVTEEEETLLRRLLARADAETKRQVAEVALPLLQAEHEQVRRRAGAVLAATTDEVVGLLVERLRSAEAREAAVTALEEMRDLRSVPPLVALLSDEDPAVRAASARVLAAVRDPQAAEPLMRASGDPDGDVREAAQDALNRLGMMGVVFGVAQLLQPLTDRVEGLERALERARLPSALPEADPPPADAEEAP